MGARSLSAAAATSTPPLFKGIGNAGFQGDAVPDVPEYLSGSEKYPNMMSSGKTVSYKKGSFRKRVEFPTLTAIKPNTTAHT